MIVVVRVLGFKQGLSGGVEGCGVSARTMKGRVEAGRAMTGRGEASHGVFGRFGETSSPPPTSGSEALGIFGVDGWEPKLPLSFLNLNMIVSVSDVVV